MMLARVADSLYWMGRYIERAEHLARLADVMLNATLDQTDAAQQTAAIAVSAVGEAPLGPPEDIYAAARSMTLDPDDPNSVIVSLARARENARQVRDQITSESWERLNILYLRVTDNQAPQAFDRASSAFLQEIIADLHLFHGAADATMSHGEGWRFLMLGVHIERAQLIARLLAVCFSDNRRTAITSHLALMSLLRMACALEPYLRVYTAEIEPRLILEFLLFNEEFPRAIRFSTARIEDHLNRMSQTTTATSRPGPQRLAGRLRARLEFADPAELAASGTAALLSTIVEECVLIHDAVYETFVAYSLETRLPD